MQQQQQEVADLSLHLPVTLGRRWGREAPGGGRCAVAQRMPRSRALLVHRGPPFVCISAVLFLQQAASGREERRIKLNHVRSLFPAQCPAQGTFQKASTGRRVIGASQASLIRRLEEVGRRADILCLQLLPGP